MAKLSIDIVTAERIVYSDTEVDKITAPGSVGELTVLPQHAALITSLQPGEMRIVKGSEEVAMAVSGGFLEVRDDKVTVLADTAERAEEIDLARAEAARQRAQERLEQREAVVDLARAEASLRRALIRLKVAERRRRREGRPGP